jgi:Ca-activated chloride channel homolog
MRFLVMLMLALGPSVFAQQGSPRLLTTLDDSTEPIHLSKLDTQVRILGATAETRTTMTFHNPHDRVLEGNLVFPLPEGVTISGYALDINGVMVDGVAVEKNRARQVFELEERRRIDPGLVEWVKGNNFQTRIHPIPARGTRTVMVRYLSELSRISGQAVYHLPLNLPEKVDQFHLRVEVIRTSVIPVITKNSIADFHFDRWHKSYVAESTLTAATLNEDLVIGIPETKKTLVWVERKGTDTYFTVADYQAAPKGGKSRIPQRITLYWDASGSRGNRDHQRELTLLERLLMQWRKKKVIVDLILFRNIGEPPKHFTVVNGKSDELLRELRSLSYDGGTQLSVISPSTGSPIPTYYLLFTDGISNYETEVPAGFKAPLYVISGDPISNHSFLSWLALSTKGEYFNLSELDDASVLNGIGRPVYQFMAARYDPAAMAETYPKTTQPVHGRFMLTGKLIAPSAKITLEFGTPGRVQRKLTYFVQKQQAQEGNILPTLWAQKKINELSVFPERNTQELIATGKQYGLVTPSTSLLVLETLEQYVHYKIEPPASLPELREEYLERLAEQNDEEKAHTKDKLDNILRLWSKRVEWWQTDYTQVKADVPPPAVPDRRPPIRATAETPVAPPQAKTEPNPAPKIESEPTRSAPKPNPSAPRTNERATLSGIMKDMTGAVLPGANIVAINAETGIETTTRAGSNGAYTFADIPSGTYKVRAEMPGFQSQTITDLSLCNNANAKFDFTLNVAGVATQVEVSVEAATMMLESSSVSGEQTISDDSIAIQPWEPDAPYLKELEKSAPEHYLATYMRQRDAYHESPSFFLDCADFFLNHGQRAIGIRVLSNLAELQLENPAFLRILAHRLSELDEYGLSTHLFETALKMRPEEPQSYRDLALVLAEQKQYARAIELLTQVIMKQWDRFDEIEVIALMELNRIIPLAREAGKTEISLDRRLIKLLDVDVRIVLTWDADNTDVDLWVTEPSGEKAFYSSPLTKAGGHVSADFTEGYGPEEYVIHHAKPGRYVIQADYYGSRAQTLQGPVTVQADVYTNYGRKNEKRQRLTLRLDKEKDTTTVGEINF